MRTISVRLDDHTDAVLQDFCERTGASQTDAVKAAIEQLARDSRPSPAELARELGLIASFDSGVGDLGRRHSDHVKARLRVGARPVSSSRRRAG